MVAQSNPHQCLDCTKIVYGKTLRCEDHRKAKKNKTRNDFMAAQRAALKGIKGGPITPQRKPPKIVKTSQQVDAECREGRGKTARGSGAAKPAAYGRTDAKRVIIMYPMGGR